MLRPAVAVQRGLQCRRSRRSFLLARLGFDLTLTLAFGPLCLAILTVLLRLGLPGLRFLLALAFGLIDLGAEILDAPVR